MNICLTHCFYDVLGAGMKRAKTLSKQELSRVLAVVAAGRNAQRNKIVILLSFYAGLRAKEIAELTVGDVYSESGEVNRTVLLLAQQTKGLNSRTFVINSKLASVLLSYKKTVTNRARCASLIKSQKNSAFSANSMCQLICRIYRDSGIAGATSHSGRRTFITNLAHKGVSARVLMELAGHKNLATTQIYIDVNDQLLFEAAELA
jgi:integrase/recombinase XerD